MLHHLFLAAAGALLMASPDSGEMSAPNDKLTEAEAISAAAGSVLGAAAACEQISKDRIDETASHVADLVAATASDDDELTSAKQLFDDNAAAGQDAVRKGEADCGSIEASLASLEKAAQPSGSSGGR